MLPNAAVPNTAFGLLNCGEFNALKASARNWKLRRPKTGKVFARERSVVNKCGPESRLRPAVPYVYRGGGANACVLMHPVRCPAPQSADGRATQSGRYAPLELVFAVS